MKKFLDENFLLQNKTAQKLYHDYAKEMPVIDYHNHLPPEQIANDINFENLTQVWLYGDHYKWRAMRTNGINEKYCTGNVSDYEKFEKWADTVPYTMRNPLYHWTHLELQRYFNIDTILNKDSARAIYDACNAKLANAEFSVRGLLQQMNVRLICTTDDPTDSLEHHQRLFAVDSFTKMNPAFRPDKAMNVDEPAGFNQYLAVLENVCGVSIATFADYLSALKNRHDYFAANHCTVSDHGLEEIYAEDYTEGEIIGIFDTIRSGRTITHGDIRKFKSAMLVIFAEWDWEKGWV